MFRPDAAGFGQSFEFRQDMHGAGKGETRRRGVFLTVVDGNDLKADLMGQPARGKGNVPAAAEYDDALMDQRLDIDAPAVEINAGRAVAPDLRQNGGGQSRGVRVEAALRRGGLGNIHEPDPKGGPTGGKRLPDGKREAARA